MPQLMFGLSDTDRDESRFLNAAKYMSGVIWGMSDQALTTNIYLEPENKNGPLVARDGSLFLDITVPIGGLLELHQV